MNKEHGKYSLCCEGQIIFLEAYEAWNEESSTSCINEMKFIVNTMQHNNFAILANSLKLEGMTPESFNLWFEALDFFFKNGHNFFIRIDKPSSIEYKLFSEPFDKITKQRMPFQFANSTNEAIKILKENNYYGFDNGIIEMNCIKNNV